ncbi:MAG TPA: type II toxin-antitoxin system RelE/ParE family toxin [Xanthobacteraceae bacterium]|nr:type II toxin-antitoxin system RelE/ParE family toxin [Xanthobacteraceae bacterium]
MITIVEMKSYQTDADRLFTEDERQELADFIAANPDFGDLIPGTGGVRKLRWRAKGSGKRGGARVIYYFRDLNMPVFLLAVYAKGEKINLTNAERNAMAALVKNLAHEYQSKVHGVSS